MSTSTHPVAPEEVMAFLDGELSSDRAQSVRTHVKECSECRQTAEVLHHNSSSLAKWTVPAVSASLADALIKASLNIKNPFPARFLSERPRLPSRLAAFAWGGAGLMVLLVFFGSFHRVPRFAGSASAKKEVFHAGPPAGPRTETRSLAELQGHRRQLAEMDIKEVPENKSSLQNGPMIARTASLSIVVKDFDTGRTALDAMLTRHNGYAASLRVSTPEGAARTLQASLRIPAPQLGRAINELKALGRVEGETQNGEEVTEQHADLVARIKNDRETEVRLQDILEKRTGKVKDVLEVEQEIARVRGEIEQMEAEQKTLEHRVEFATIDLRLADEYQAQLNTPAPSVLIELRNASINGFRNAFESLLGLVLFLAEFAPSLIVWVTLLGIPAWRLWRRYRRAQSLCQLAGASPAER